MEIVRLAAYVVDVLLLIYLFVMVARLILDYIPMFNRDWRPRGVGLVLAEAAYTVTDPPLKFFRRVLPSVRIGPIALDLGFPATMLSVFVLLTVVRVFERL
ncbi:MAG: YggT family protein [Microbacterium sp.]